MKKFLIQYAVCALSVALMVPLARAQSQPAGLQAPSQKMPERFSDNSPDSRALCRPSTTGSPPRAFRSVAEVFNLIVKENGLLAGVLSGTRIRGTARPITDPEKMQEALKASYVNLQKAITALSDNDLQAPVKLFGRDWTKRRADAHSRRSTRASGAVDRVRASKRRGSALVQVRAPIASNTGRCAKLMGSGRSCPSPGRSIIITALHLGYC